VSGALYLAKLLTKDNGAFVPLLGRTSVSVGCFTFYTSDEFLVYTVNIWHDAGMANKYCVAFY